MAAETLTTSRNSNAVETRLISTPFGSSRCIRLERDLDGLEMLVDSSTGSLVEPERTSGSWAVVRSDCTWLSIVPRLFTSQLRIPYNTIPLTKALIVETFGKNKNIFVSPIASFVNHCTWLYLIDSSPWYGGIPTGHGKHAWRAAARHFSQTSLTLWSPDPRVEGAFRCLTIACSFYFAQERQVGNFTGVSAPGAKPD